MDGHEHRGKIVVITGASSGRRSDGAYLAERGATVVWARGALSDFRRSSTRLLSGRQGVAIVTDVTERPGPGARRSAVARTVALT